MSEGLESLLDNLHGALMAGRLDDLSLLIEDLDKAASALMVQDPEQLARLRQKTLRNERCLLAALSGVRMAQIRIQEIGQAARGLTTYDSKGATSVLPSRVNPGRRA